MTEDLSVSSFLDLPPFGQKSIADDLLIDVQRSLDRDEFFFFFKDCDLD